jgi:hypothetical protein
MSEADGESTGAQRGIYGVSVVDVSIGALRLLNSA